MNKSKVTELNIQKGNSLNFFQPADAWGTIFVFVFVTAILLGVGSTGSKILNVLYPLGAFIVGWRLYFHHPVLYTGFVWWLFFLTPLIRRVADFRAGTFSESSPILLAPYAAIIVCAHTLYLNLSKTREQGSAPFVIAIAGVIYGYMVGLINTSDFTKVTVSFLEWMSPLLFAYHLYIYWDRYPAYCRNFQRVFLWGVLIMGAYGVYQYLVAPEWDRLWLINAPGMLSTAGKPVPLGIRVWSTMNAPGPFSCYMATGLLILFSCQSILVLPTAGLGALAFLLSAVRTGWIGWFFGMIVISTSIQPKQQFKLVIAMVVLAALVIPLATIEPFSSTIISRVETLSDITNDGSYQERQFLYKALFDEAITTYIGKGLSLGGGFDSAVLVMLFELGWIGSIPYIGGLIIVVISIFKSRKKASDIFASIIRAIIISALLYLLAGATMKGGPGMLLWPFLGMGMAGRNYYYYESRLVLDSEYI